MPRMAAFLRGVNLGGHRKIAMAELRQVLSAGGFSGVETHLQSGNVLFEGIGPPDGAAQRMEELIARSFGHDVPVLVRTREELARVADENPLRALASNPSRYLVWFLSAQPDPDRKQSLDAEAFRPDTFAFGDRALYVWCPNGVSESKLTAPVLERRLGVIPTARNWNTVEAVLSKL